MDTSHYELERIGPNGVKKLLTTHDIIINNDIHPTNKKYIDGWTAMHFKASNNHLKTIPILIIYDVIVNKKNDENRPIWI